MSISTPVNAGAHHPGFGIPDPPDLPSPLDPLAPLPASRRRGSGLVVGLVLTVLLAGGVIAWQRWGLRRGGRADYLTARVRSGSLPVLVTEHGNLESSSNTEVVCQVEGETNIVSILPEGVHVDKGQVVIQLDASALKDKFTQQKIVVEQANAAYIQAQEALTIQKEQSESDIKAAELAIESAQIDLTKYLQGDYEQDRRTIQADLTVAKEELSRAQNALTWSRKLHDKGYLSDSDLEADELAVLKARNAAEQAREKLRLLEDFTFLKTKRELESSLQEARRALIRVKATTRSAEAQALADLKSKQATCELEKSKLEKHRDQIAKATVRAPRPGLVVYSNDPFHWGSQTLQIEQGATVRERQPLFRLPDINAMQVNVKVHESKVDLVRVGQKAEIRVDAFPDRVLPGTVKSVAVLPDPNMWLSSDVKLYTTLAKIDGTVPDLKPGMTAEVRVRVRELSTAVLAPVQAIGSRDGAEYAYVITGSKPERRVVQTGLTNDEFVQIVKGLRPGDEVVLNPATVFEEPADDAHPGGPSPPHGPAKSTTKPQPQPPGGPPSAGGAGKPKGAAGNRPG